MLEIDHYYDIYELEDLEIWKREYNIPPRETAPGVLASEGKRSLTPGLWSLMGPWADSLEHANRGFNVQRQGRDSERAASLPGMRMYRRLSGSSLTGRGLYSMLQSEGS